MLTVPTTEMYQEVYEWLKSRAEELGLRVSLLTDEAMLRSGWLYLPVHIEGVTDAYDDATKLQRLEDTWNDRDPQPQPPLFLIPAKDPLRRATWEREAEVLRRKFEAVEAFGKATSLEEQEQAAAEFRQAGRVEQEARQTYGPATPRNGRVP